MKRFLILGLFALLGLPAIGQEADAVPEPVVMLEIRDATDVALADFLWLNRLIVVFADTDRDPAFQRQMELLSERPAALFERDVVVVIDTNPRRTIRDPNQAAASWFFVCFHRQGRRC